MKRVKIPLVQKFLTNKYVLYLVFFAALVEILSLLTIRDYDSLGLFIVVGLLASYFTKNMTMILIAAMGFTNCRVCSNLINRNMYMLEGLANKKVKRDGEGKPGGVADLGVFFKKADGSGDEKCTLSTNPEECQNTGLCYSDAECTTADTKWGKKVGKSGVAQRNVPSSKPAQVNGDDDDDSPGKRVDYAATLEMAYDNLNNMVGDKGMKGLTDETKKLVGQQKELMGALNGMAPVLQNAKKTLENLDMPDLKNLQGMMATLNKAK